MEENKYHDVIYNIKICSRQSVYSDGIVNRRKFKDEDVKADRQNVFDYSFCTECNTHLTHDDKNCQSRKLRVAIIHLVFIKKQKYSSGASFQLRGIFGGSIDSIQEEFPLVYNHNITMKSPSPTFNDVSLLAIKELADCDKVDYFLGNLLGHHTINKYLYLCPNL